MRRVAPRMQKMIKFRLLDEGGTRELKALLAVARAARSVRALRRPLEWTEREFWTREPPINCNSDADTALHRALARLDRASGGKG